MMLMMIKKGGYKPSAPPDFPVETDKIWDQARGVCLVGGWVGGWVVGRQVGRQAGGVQ